MSESILTLDIKTLSVKEINEMVSEIGLEEYAAVSEALMADERKAIQKIGEKLARDYNKVLFEEKRLEGMKSFEYALYEKGCIYIAGTDEVGRGPLAGPVVAAAVILPREFKVLGVNDSKKLSEKKREELYFLILNEAVSFGIGIVDNDKIDEINILNASKLAMKIACEKLNRKPDHLLVDAVHVDHLDIPQTGIIKGDSKSITIAAASIVAKVTRDRMMVEYHEQHPHYDFINNKGYGTALHYEGIRTHGLCPLHRKTFLKEYIVR